MRDCNKDRRVTLPKRVTSPTWGLPPPCKQALSVYYLRKTAIQIKEISTVILNRTRGKNVRRECHYI